MSNLQACPKCGKQMKIGRVRTHSTFTERRRDCRECGHGDKIHVRIEVREELLAIIDVAKRAKRVVRQRTLKATQTKTTRNNEAKETKQC